MSAPKDELAPLVVTIGHSTRPLAEFIGLPQWLGVVLMVAAMIIHLMTDDLACAVGK
jgi:hypothetical protein